MPITGKGPPESFGCCEMVQEQPPAAQRSPSYDVEQVEMNAKQQSPPGSKLGMFPNGACPLPSFDESVAVPSNHINAELETSL